MINRTKYIHFLKFWLPVYLYAGLIFAYSAQAQLSLAPRMLHGDKLLHVLEYAILSYLVARGAFNSSSLKLKLHFRLLAVMFAFVYGLSDEFHQSFVPGRQADLFDVLADGLGACLGHLIIRS
ncbi:VanZ family protein [Candidatus Omnitrophota bacterium]